MEGSTRNIRLGVLSLITAFFVGAVQNALIKSIHDYYPYPLWVLLVCLYRFRWMR